MFATANWCLAVVQGTVRSWLPLGLSSPAIRSMANAGACPRSLRWGHGGPLGESWVASLPWGWNRAYSGVWFWRWWVSQGNWPSGSHDLMYPPRSAGAGFAFRSALALRMAVAR